MAMFCASNAMPDRGCGRQQKEAGRQEASWRERRVSARRRPRFSRLVGHGCCIPPCPAGDGPDHHGPRPPPWPCGASTGSGSGGAGGTSGSQLRGGHPPRRLAGRQGR